MVIVAIFRRKDEDLCYTLSRNADAMGLVSSGLEMEVDMDRRRLYIVSEGF
jgi:hypothetical protein